MPATPYSVWKARSRSTAERSRRRPTCKHSTMPTPDVASPTPHALAGGAGAKLLAGGQSLLAVDEAAACAAPISWSTWADQGAARHHARTATRRDRRDDDATPTSAATPTCRQAIPALAGARRQHRRPPGAQPAAPSAARWPTTIRPPATRRRCWPRARRSTPTSARSRPTTFQGPVRNGAGGRRAHHRGQLPDARRRRPTQKFKQPASRFALVGVFVAQDGRAACASRSPARARRVPRQGAGGQARRRACRRSAVRRREDRRRRT